jgi:hypothetical protein
MQENSVSMKAILTEGTLEEMDAIVTRSYVKAIEGMVGDELFEYHLMHLEIAVSHLATMSYGLPNLTTVRGNNLAILVRIYAEFIDGMLLRHHSSMLGAIWPVTSKLLSLICNYDGAHDRLHKAIWFAHRASKLIIETWFESAPRATQIALYYSKEENDFALGLSPPILTTMSTAGNIDSFVRCATTFLSGMKDRTP